MKWGVSTWAPAMQPTARDKKTTAPGEATRSLPFPKRWGRVGQGEVTAFPVPSQAFPSPAQATLRPQLLAESTLLAGQFLMASQQRIQYSGYSTQPGQQEQNHEAWDSWQVDSVKRDAELHLPIFPRKMKEAGEAT